ncbi:MAG: hypothetical protein M3N59_00310 [bacterium]|nr:hypothetical protein [bacterium]
MAKSSGAPWLILGGGVFLASLAMIPVLLVAAALAGTGGGGGGEDAEEFTDVGDVEFKMTYYDPGQGGINGSNCGGAHGRFCLKDGTPTGYEVTEDRTGKTFTGGGAIPQTSQHEGGSVNVADVPLYYDHSEGTKGKAILIPCYNDDKPFLPLDHFATSVTEPNALDLVMTGAASDRFRACLEERGIRTSPTSNGHGAATLIKGKIVELE